MNTKFKLLAALAVAAILVPATQSRAYTASSYVSPAGVWTSSPCVSLEEVPCELQVAQGGFDPIGDIGKTVGNLFGLIFGSNNQAEPTAQKPQEAVIGNKSANLAK